MVTIRRNAAIGDILMVTPIIQALRYEYGRVGLTVTPSLYEKMRALLHSPALEIVKEPAGPVIDLNNAYELRPHMHPVEAYCEVAGIKLDETTAMFCNISGLFPVYDVVLHPTVSWPNRTLSRFFWTRLAAILKTKGLSVACVAQNPGEAIEGCDKTYVGLSLTGVAGLIDNAKVFICGDSAPLHLAACTDTPIVGLFTIALAERRHPWRHERHGFTGINAAVDCVGCLHRAGAVPFYECDHPKDSPLFQQCLDGFSIPEIVEAVEKHL